MSALVEKVENGYLITRGEKCWVATTAYEVSKVLEKIFVGDEDEP